MVKQHAMATTECVHKRRTDGSRNFNLMVGDSMVSKLNKLTFSKKKDELKSKMKENKRESVSEYFLKTNLYLNLHVTYTLIQLYSRLYSIV